MKLEQAVGVLQMIKEELFERHSVLSVDLYGNSLRVHLGSQDIFEALPAEPVFKCSSKSGIEGYDYDYDHFIKTIDNVTYLCLYPNGKKVACPISTEQAAGRGEGVVSN